MEARVGMIRHTHRALVCSLLGVVLFAASCTDESPTTPESLSDAAPALATAAAGPLAFWQVSAGRSHGCGVTSDNRAYCWGTGALGDGSISSKQKTPLPVSGSLLFRQISAGAGYTCGVTTNNKAYCWGNNSSGQLGDGTTAQRLTPTLVSGGFRFRQIESGSGHTCAVSTASKAYCWGYNGEGQLGNGTTQDRWKPVVVAGGQLYKQVSAGITHSCGITTSNQAFCWGSDRSGELGNGPKITPQSRPTLVAGGHSFRQVDASIFVSCAVTTGDRAFCWGNGEEGQLGDGSYEARFSPSAVAGGLFFDRVTTGVFHTCGETRNNKAYCWGYNGFGELGYGPGLSRSAVPVAVAGGLFFSQVSGGNHFTCAKTDSGKGYCWGVNSLAELGDGTTTTRLTPVAMAGAE
jgi:alpha-tubulin suppressor-like RCC1 family protein